jgi:hypothetical protein
VKAHKYRSPDVRICNQDRHIGGVDGSAESDAAIRWTTHEAVMRHETLTLAHVGSIPVPFRRRLWSSNGAEPEEIRWYASIGVRACDLWRSPCSRRC